MTKKMINTLIDKIVQVLDNIVSKKDNIVPQKGYFILIIHS